MQTKLENQLHVLGYWAKLNFGEPVKKNPLGPPREDVSDRVLVTVFTPVEMPEEVANTAATLDNRVVAFLVFMQNPH